jgi:epoxyqueuosine reductase QueG
MKSLESRIQEYIQRHTSREYLIGYSYLEHYLPKKYKNLKYGITVAVKLDDEIIAKIKRGPTPEYEKHYHEMNSTLNLIAKDIRRILRRQKNKAEMVGATLEANQEKKLPNYYKTLSVDFSHKTAATRSGLGWIGKTALFVSPRFGPRVRLVTVLTDKILKTGQPAVDSICGNCDICVKRCPAKAANGSNWNVGMKREDFYDAHKCRNTAKELSQKRLNTDETLCGICVAVCPIGEPRDK